MAKRIAEIAQREVDSSRKSNSEEVAESRDSEIFTYVLKQKVYFSVEYIYFFSTNLSKEYLLLMADKIFNSFGVVKTLAELSNFSSALSSRSASHGVDRTVVFTLLDLFIES